MNPTTRPSLEYTNGGKNVSIQRGEEHHLVNPGSTFELLDGDIISATSHILIRCVFHWAYFPVSGYLAEFSGILCVVINRLLGVNPMHHWWLRALL